MHAKATKHFQMINYLAVEAVALAVTNLTICQSSGKNNCVAYTCTNKIISYSNNMCNNRHHIYLHPSSHTKAYAGIIKMW